MRPYRFAAKTPKMAAKFVVLTDTGLLLDRVLPPHFCDLFSIVFV